VAIADGVVYATSYDGHIYALNPDNGDLIWQFPADIEPGDKEPADEDTPLKERIEPKAFSYAAPTVHEGMLYVGNLDGYMYAIHTKDGSLKWRFKTGSGITSSALVHAGTLYFGSKDNHLYAIDAATGSQVKWKFKAGGDVLSSPKISDGVIFIGSNDKNFYAIDAKTGQEKCHFTAAGEVISYGAFYKNLVFFGGGQNDGHIYAINQADCSLFFKYKTGYKIESDPILLDNNLYITSGDRKLYAFKINKTTKD
jgi:outer membrane protein assembly factor BamB